MASPKRPIFVVSLATRAIFKQIGQSHSAVICFWEFHAKRCKAGHPLMVLQEFGTLVFEGGTLGHLDFKDSAYDYLHVGRGRH